VILVGKDGKPVHVGWKVGSTGKRIRVSKATGEPV
jgi:hypothetical protein